MGLVRPSICLFVCPSLTGCWDENENAQKMSVWNVHLSPFCIFQYAFLSKLLFDYVFRSTQPSTRRGGKWVAATGCMFGVVDWSGGMAAGCIAGPAMDGRISLAHTNQQPLLRLWWLTQVPCSSVSATASTHHLRSAASHQLAVPSYRTLSLYVNRLSAFSVTGPTTWNLPPRHLCDPVHTIFVFGRLLKTFFSVYKCKQYTRGFSGVDALYNFTLTCLLTYLL